MRFTDARAGGVRGGGIDKTRITPWMEDPIMLHQSRSEAERGSRVILENSTVCQIVDELVCYALSLFG